MGEETVLKLLSPEAEAALVRLIDERVAHQLDTVGSNPANGSPWMTVAEAAEYLRTTPGAIYKRIRRGHLRSYHPEGSGIRIWREDLDAIGPEG
jgi:excisionase family DNA binding protein